MQTSIQRFEIRGLHQSRDYNIPIRDNRIVMVGVNGLGKTTVVNLLFLVLSRQWERTLDYEFDEIRLTINDREYVLKAELEFESIGLSPGARFRDYFTRVSSREYESMSLDMYDYFAKISLHQGRDALARELDRMTPLSPTVCRKIALSFNPAPKTFNKELLDELDGSLKEITLNSQILYLPTYRRIEKDLSLILPGFDESTPSYRRRTLNSPERPDYIELVEFGMEDVESTFIRVQSTLVQRAKMEFNTLAGENLRDVIRGQGNTYDQMTFDELDSQSVDRVLNRVDERTLMAETDKRNLRAVIEKLKSKSKLAENDAYIAHFFSKLIAVDRALSAREQQIVRFTEVCNKYLSGKEMVYRDTDSAIFVRLNSNQSTLPLRALSSGEKQIVSLFSHLYLRDLNSLFVIIDEPELSLSVNWQKQLLPDILETGSCRFLCAVTHSPFIFKNSLDDYAVDLATCIAEHAK